MSLLADPDWLIYQLRLSYLRRLDDHHGPRVISFPEPPAPRAEEPQLTSHLKATTSSHGLASTDETSHQPSSGDVPMRQAAGGQLPLRPAAPDSHVAIARLNDPARHPEIAMAYSPTIAPPAAQRTLRNIPSGNLTLSPPSGSEAARIAENRSGRRRGSDSAARHQPLQPFVLGAATQGERQEQTWETSHPEASGSTALKHTQTIYGPGRSGALGMRVSGRKRAGARSFDSNLSAATAPNDSIAPSKDLPHHSPDRVRSNSTVSADAIASQNTSSGSSGISRPAPGHDASAIEASEVSRSLPAEPEGNLFSSHGRKSFPSGDDTVPNSQELATSLGSPATQQGHMMSASLLLEIAEARRSSAATDMTVMPKAGSSSPTSEHKATLSEGPASGSSLPLRRRPQTLRHPPSDASLSSLASEPSTFFDGSTDDEAMAPAEDLRGDAWASQFHHGLSDDIPSRRRASARNRTGKEASSIPDLSLSSPSDSARRTLSGSDNVPAPSPNGPIPLLTVEKSSSEGVSPMQPKSRTLPRLKRPTQDILKPSSEALIAARSKLRKPSRSHLQGMTLAQRTALREKQQNDWFQSMTISNQQVALRHNASSRAAEKPSALSLLLRKQSSAPENPFAQYYAGIAGRSAAAGTAGTAQVDVYFPWASNHQSQSAANPVSGALSVNASARCLKLSVRKDATMEELIGYGLFCYCEEGWQPALTDKIPADIFLTTVGWVLRIVEDGEVDDDYPSLDRSLTVGKFGGDEFAICEASEVQRKQHQAAFSLIHRRASRTAGGPSRAGAVGTAGPQSLAPLGVRNARALSTNTPLPTQVTPSQNNLAPYPPQAGPVARLVTGAQRGVAGNGPGTSSSAGPVPGSVVSMHGTPILAGSSATPLGSLSNAGASGSASGYSSRSPAIFLRVLITPNNEVRYKTTLSVPSEMYLADVLDLICRKRHLSSPDEWALIVPAPSDDPNGRDIVVPLDRTVESLQGSHDLVLVRRVTLGAQGGAAALAGQSTNPNASIFRTNAEQATGTGSDAARALAGGMAGSRSRAQLAAGGGLPGNGVGAGMLGLASTVYKSWTVTRKLPPMFHVGSHRQHERTLTIDGDWIHIIPSDSNSRSFQAHAASFPIADVASCKQSTKLPTAFKILVAAKRADRASGDGGLAFGVSGGGSASTSSSGRQQKRYDLEAEDARQAGEIVGEVNRRRRDSRR